MFSLKFLRVVFSVLSTVLFITTVAVAQVPAPTPRTSPVRPDATKPPGQEQNPALPPGSQPQTSNPKAPPGTQQTSPVAPPATTSTPTSNPAAPTSTPAPTTVDQEPREPVIPQFQAQPMPPLPDMSRLGVTNTTIPLSLNDAIKRALENNNDIEIARDDVRIAETQLRALEGIFDPIFSITPQIDKRVIPVQNIFAGGGTSGSLSNTTLTLSPTVTKQFGRGGGNYQLTFSNSRTTTTATNSTLNPFYSSNLSLGVVQPLWRNRSIDNNRRQIRIQRKRIQQSDADFRLRTIDTITRVQQAYWELVFALRDQQNQLENLNLTRENLRNVDAQIAAGAKAPLERAEVQTELASRETALLTAVQNVSVAENNLKQLIFKERSSADWSAQITPSDSPSFNEAPVNLTDAMKDAQENRPELRRLRLEAEVNSIDLTFFKNQTKPQFDLEAVVATTGLAGTPAASLPAGISPNPTLVGGYSKTLENVFSFNTYNVTVGVAIQIPFKNKTAQANLAGAKIQQEQLLASMRSTEQTVEVDVRNAAQAVESSRRRVLSARQARVNAELQLEGEQRLYQVGRSTTFLLFQRQNALTNSRASELRAQTDYNKAIADLQRATATTLRANNVIVQTPSVP
ncbi:MAG TPA: TolC family protein [Pyrinomonadaceae bacterium]|nr:TolC family protein [Pyrinomonadaceae bacterium]